MAAQRQSADLNRATWSPTDPQGSIQAGHGDQPLNRRRALRMLCALAAVAAGTAALSAARPEEASATTGTLNYTSSDGFATIQAYDTGSGDAIYGSATNSNGMEGTTTAGHTSVNGPAGVVGWTNAAAGVGVIGQGTAGDGIGVWGQGGNIGVEGDGASIGVYANGGVYGVEGNSSSGSGVVGLSQSGTNAGVRGVNLGGGPAVYGFNAAGVGVKGQSSSSSNTSPGVYGLNTGGGPAIVGQATGSGFGFSAVTQTGTGCFGGASGAGTGVFAYSVGGTALSALAAGGGNIAGYFGGPVIITGALSVMGAKSAAVRAADGKLRRLYSLESPESWFEDFGSGQLSGGTATVQLESGFAGLVHGDNYRVFLTPRGESKGWLYIGKQSFNGFTVQEAAGGTSNIAFDYRVVAKRKDIAGARLEQVDEPPTLEVPAFPTLPAVEPPPVAPRGHGTDR